MRILDTALTLVVATAASSCIGTIGTRIAAPHFGWPPVPAVTQDCLWVSGHNRKLTHDSGFLAGVPLVVYVAFLSVPLDMAIDTALLPVDLVVTLVDVLQPDPPQPDPAAGEPR